MQPGKPKMLMPEAVGLSLDLNTARKMGRDLSLETVRKPHWSVVGQWQAGEGAGEGLAPARCEVIGGCSLGSNRSDWV